MLTGNSAFYGGGAAYCTLYNCTLKANKAVYDGGGAEYSTLNNCMLTGNSALTGGGAYAGTLYNCTLTSNSARQVCGGALGSTLYNCIVYYNTAPNSSSNYYSSTTLNYCCTTPMPSGGTGNLVSEPLFVNPSAGDYHLMTNSPCIDHGLNDYAPPGTDLDGNPRIWNGVVDIGAYEFQPLAAFHAWLAQHGLPADGTADYLDSDSDGMNNWQEWLAGTYPTDPKSVFRLLSPVSAPEGITVSWTSVTNRVYALERCAGPLAAGGFQLVVSNISGAAGTTGVTDTNQPANSAVFYRVRIQP